MFSHKTRNDNSFRPCEYDDVRLVNTSERNLYRNIHTDTVFGLNELRYNGISGHPIV